MVMVMMVMVLEEPLGRRKVDRTIHGQIVLIPAQEPSQTNNITRVPASSTSRGA